MADYDFSTLNSSDLEELVCDLLNLDQPTNSLIKYKTFKDGKDKGIDFLYSSATNNYEQVGQVKHYYRTGFAGMYKVLKDTEVNNVQNLKPNKYIFATSVDLSLANTNAIKDLFNPYIKSLGDIYGKKDLNRLIENHDEILNTHYKLWLSDFTILSKLLNSALEFRSAAFVELELKKRLRLYIKTPLFDDAKKSLEKNKFIVITGEPGVGKTTLAEMLVYKYIADDYKLTYIYDDIKEAESALTPDDSKQLIYFDDFLGSTKVEINKAKGSENALISILRRIERLSNKLVVFTTRSFLFKTAIEESEKLKRFNIKAKSSLFELKEYDDNLKRQLLINHIEESEISDDLKDVLNDYSIQMEIIRHSSFSPRSVEFITTAANVGNFKKEEYLKFVRENFDFPDKIWKHAYNEQIFEDDRLLLNTLLSFGEISNLNGLEEAFNSRIQYEIENNNKQREMFAFRKALNRLEGGFLILKNEDEVHFINPSLIDFLVKYLREDKEEVLKIANSVKYVSQLTERLFSLGSLNGNKMSSNLEKRLLEDYQSFISNANGDFDLIQLALVIYKYIDNIEKEQVVCEIIDSITEWEALHEDYSLNSHFKEFMFEVKDNENINSVLQERIEEIVSELFSGKNDINEAIDLLEELIRSFDINFNDLNTINITNHLDDLFAEHIANEVQWLFDWMTYEDEAQEKLDEVNQLVKRINELGIEYEADTEEFQFDWYDVAMENELHRLMGKDD